MQIDPTIEPRFQRAVGMVKWLLFLGLGTILFMLSQTQVWKGEETQTANPPISSHIR